MAIYEKMPDRCACNFLPALLHTLLFTKIVLNILLQLVRDEMYPKSLLISLLAPMHQTAIALCAHAHVSSILL